MELFPAIDLLDGACVRLRQGDFADVTVYDKDPVAMASRLVQAGARWIHVVDLNGARDGAARQTDLVKKIVAATGLRLQMGGGIRSRADIETLLDAGVTRVVVGSLAAENPDLVREWMRVFGGEKIVLAFDVRLDAQGVPEILTRGWQAGSSLSLWDGLARYADVGLRTVLCTDVARDGMQGGANHDLYKAILARCPSLQVLASGGVRDQLDLKELAALGVSGAIIGKAMYEGVIDIAAALEDIK